MLKKIILFIALSLLAAVNIAALSVPEDFYIYGKDTNMIANILDMSGAELKNYVERTDITYLAVNKKNTKQIKKIEFEDSFSKMVESFLSLDDKEILSFAESLSGIPDAKGKIIEKENKKYLKVTAKTEDSGGDYISTQYITVNDGKYEILSFYTSSDESTDYIDEVFNSQFTLKSRSALKTAAAIGVALFTILAAVVLWAIIKETFIKKSSEKSA